MIVPAALLLLAAAAPDSASKPITVTGHVWAPFISPMGEPFRPRSAADDTVANWFNQADRDRDGFLTADEMQADAERFFGLLDLDANGEIDPEELVRYEWEVAPDIQVMSKTRRAAGQSRPQDLDERRAERRRSLEAEASLGLGGALQGAARYSLLNIPEPVAAADADLNRGVTLAEFRQAALERFRLLDRERAGRLTLAGLKALLPELPVPGTKIKREPKARDSRVGQSLPPDN